MEENLYCAVCDQRYESPSDYCEHLIKLANSDDVKRMKQRRELLDKLKPIPLQLEAINELLLKERLDVDSNLKGVHEEMTSTLVKVPTPADCKGIVETIIADIKAVVLEMEHEDVKLELYGSRLSGTHTDDSDVNLRLDVPAISDSDACPFMRKLSEEITGKLNTVENVKMTTEQPFTIHFNHGNLVVRLSWRPYKLDECIPLSSLLLKYCQHTPTLGPLIAAVRYWAKKAKLISPRGTDGLSGCGFDVMVVHFLQVTDKLPVLPDEGDGPAKELDVAEELLNFLAYYSCPTFEQRRYMIQIESREPVLRQPNKKSKTVKLFQIRYPQENKNIARFSKSFLSYFRNCFLISYVYFAMPQLSSGPLYAIDLCQKNYDQLKERKSAVAKNLEKLLQEESSKEKISFEELFIDSSSLNTDQEEQLFVKSDLHYTMDSANFTNGYVPETFCDLCEEIDHTIEECSLNKIHTVDLLSEEDHTKLSRAISDDYEQRRPDPESVQKCREEVYRIGQKLEGFFKQKVRLNLYGSLDSGFGHELSDLDVCFRFEDETPPPFLEPFQVLTRARLRLFREPNGFKVLQSRFRARVPILTFRSLKLDREIDMAYYNTLALENTRMLRTYCKWDSRVSVLGVWIKRWAQACGIGDASVGSLSSYTWVILTIHYLQRCQPPVLPLLQQLHRKPRTARSIGQWDTYFFDGQPTENWSQNRQTISQLFVGFLDYYSTFDYKAEVVQIRQSEPLFKSEKEWTKGICIEDPFELTRNLAGGLDRNMQIFIMRSLHNSRAVLLEPLDVNDSTQINDEDPSDLCDQVLKRCNAGVAPNRKIR